MWTTYLRVALRTLDKRKGHTALNVAGLTLGMACCLLIFQYVAYETSFDQFHAKKDRIHRAAFRLTQNGVAQNTSANVGYLFGPTVAEEVPEVVRYARIHPNYGEAVVSYREGPTDRTFTEGEVLFVDSTFLRMFDFPLVAEDEARALTEPHTMLVSETMARKYFGDENPVGKALSFTGWVDETYTVAGVLADVPPTSHLRFN
ncbi:MAG: ABC transporter permease, partial [Rhodothermales bacterium]|nr:ABC transporter permease [Rhodothermales bacterium]